uniref:Germin-like protein n=1 Tax=Oryza glumipatula TaxID=40148 RepID=A0A0E0BJU9_9ORYZ
MKLSTVLCCYLLLLGLFAPEIISDSPPLQDVCPMAPQGERKLFMNGFFCKSPSTIMASDFKTLLLNHAGDLDNMVRSSANIVTATEFPGLNTLGISMARTDIASSGAVLPHSHPRASEMMFVHSGNVVAGFFDTKGKLFQKTLAEGDVFIFPRGLVHFIMNYGFGLATTFSVLNSQNPGVVGITHAMFVPDSEVAEGLMARMLSFRDMRMDDNSNRARWVQVVPTYTHAREIICVHGYTHYYMMGKDGCPCPLPAGALCPRACPFTRHNKSS